MDFFKKKRVGRVGGTCGRKPWIMFWYITDSKCCFGIFFNKTWDYTIIWIHVFSNTKKHILLQWIRCSSFVWIFVVLDYDEMNCNLVFGVFYNVFWSANSSYMQ
jgi:hypothetical protein